MSDYKLNNDLFCDRAHGVGDAVGVSNDELNLQLSSLLTQLKSTTEPEAIAERWSQVCQTIFLDDAGYDFNEEGISVFIPSTLTCQVTTPMLAELLKVSEEMERDETTYEYVVENDYQRSIVSHLRQRADSGDKSAQEELYLHAQRKLFSAEEPSAESESDVEDKIF